MSLQFKIQLTGITNPPITREVVVNEKVTFQWFHEIIQVCMGWENYHMYEFLPVGNLKKGLKLNYKSSKAKLSDYFNEVGDKITYIYDFGDDWNHEITLKKIWSDPIDHPKVIAGEGKCPPEDCGGVWGYMDLIEKLDGSKDEDLEDRREWLGLDDGETWDVNEVDMEEVQMKLQKMG